MQVLAMKRKARRKIRCSLEEIIRELYFKQGCRVTRPSGLIIGAIVLGQEANFDRKEVLADHQRIKRQTQLGSNAIFPRRSWRR
jgi:hypothetical protein